jgi:hypothetical protein
VLLTGVTTAQPAETAVVLLLQEEAAHPEVFGNAALVVETVLLLADVQPDAGLLEDGEGAHGGSVVGWDLEVLALGLLLRAQFEGLGRVDWTGDHGRVVVEGEEEDGGEERGQLGQFNGSYLIVVAGVVVAKQGVSSIAVLEQEKRQIGLLLLNVAQQGGSVSGVAGNRGKTATQVGFDVLPCSQLKLAIGRSG